MSFEKLLYDDFELSLVFRLRLKDNPIPLPKMFLVAVTAAIEKSGKEEKLLVHSW